MQISQAPARPYVFSHSYSLRFLATLKRSGCAAIAPSLSGQPAACPSRQCLVPDISIRNTFSAKHAEALVATKRCHHVA
jgi:hypothetical protein